MEKSIHIYIEEKSVENINVAFIGSVGVPNIYGGFEMFLDSCAPEMATRVNRVYVTCDGTKYKNHDQLWNNVHRVFIDMNANGIGSVWHDCLAFKKIYSKADVIVVLGVSAGIFFPIFRLLCALGRKKLIVNVDGVEWRRDKFSTAKKIFLLISDRLAQLFAHRVIVDSEALRPYLMAHIRNSAVYIPYPGDHVERLPDIKNNLGEPNCLTICRIEPENNCHILIEAFSKLNFGHYTFIGNWNSSDYGRRLREKYAYVKNLEMCDPIYDKLKLAELREQCTCYLHGHSVGGTKIGRAHV